MSRVCFPYSRGPKSASDDPKRPYVFMELQAHSGQWFKVNPLADTGADISAFPRGVCEILGKKLESGEKKTIVSATGSKLSVFLHTVRARIGTNEFDLTVGFTFTHEFPHLLGRRDLLEHFNLNFGKDDIWFQEI